LDEENVVPGCATPPVIGVTVYDKIALPPSDPAAHDTIACPVPATAETDVGAAGLVTGCVVVVVDALASVVVVVERGIVLVVVVVVGAACDNVVVVTLAPSWGNVVVVAVAAASG
jgi:hypothetical protein